MVNKIDRPCLACLFYLPSSIANVYHLVIPFSKGLITVDSQVSGLPIKRSHFLHSLLSRLPRIPRRVQLLRQRITLPRLNNKNKNTLDSNAVAALFYPLCLFHYISCSRSQRKMEKQQIGTDRYYRRSRKRVSRIHCKLETLPCVSKPQTSSSNTDIFVATATQITTMTKTVAATTTSTTIYDNHNKNSKSKNNNSMYISP